jgi:hypothetical protein
MCAAEKTLNKPEMVHFLSMYVTIKLSSRRMLSSVCSVCTWSQQATFICFTGLV